MDNNPETRRIFQVLRLWNRRYKVHYKRYRHSDIAATKANNETLAVTGQDFHAENLPHLLAAQAIAHAQQQARTREQQLSAQMEAIQNDAQSQLETLESRLAIERAAADNRVRDLAREYAARSARTNSAPTASCQTAEIRARLLADLLGELDELATVFAAEADRRMIAGKACEMAYQSARE